MHIKENANCFYITVGGKIKTDCIEMFVYKASYIAKLQQIDYNEQCTLQPPLDNGFGTRNMIETSLYALKKLFPHIEYITLDDYSTIKCENGFTPSLLYYYVAFKGETWYEMFLGAKPNGMKLEKKYIKIKEELNDPKEKMDTNLFINFVINSCSENDKQYLTEKYNKSETYKSFFDILKKNNVNICYQRFNWIERLFTINDLSVPRNWIINMEKFTQHDYLQIKDVSSRTLIL